MAKLKIPGGIKQKKIIDAMPRELKKALDKPKLRDLTFADIETVEKQLEKLAERDPVAYLGAACGACSGWPN
jgi:hypothetical protein